MADYNLSDAELPTMVIRCDNMLVLRSIITGQHLQTLCEAPSWKDIPLSADKEKERKQTNDEYIKALESLVNLFPCDDIVQMPTTKPPIIPERCKSPENPLQLPPCKVQRNYCCTFCSYYTQNPRSHLQHQRDVHGIRLSIHSCQHCQYASRYFQKLKRHIKMVHTPSGQDATLATAAATTTTSGNQAIVKPKESPIWDTTKVHDDANQQTDDGEQRPPMPMVKPSGTFDIIPKIPPKPLVAKSDPEAFFVAAYKSQIQEQFENEQRLKDIMKLCRQELHQESKTSLEDITPSTSSFLGKPPIENKKQNIPIGSVPNETKKCIFNCRKCNYVTHIKSRYNKHVKYHSMPVIQCDKCEFRTTYKWNLTRHLRSHHGNGIYKCSVCSFSAHTKQSLTSHEMNHHSPPIGCAVGSKPMRKRRCRVGGSDLHQHDGNAPKDSLGSKEKMESVVDPPIVDQKVTTEVDMDISPTESICSNVMGMAETESILGSESSYADSDFTDSIDSCAMHIDADENVGSVENFDNLEDNNDNPMKTSTPQRNENSDKFGEKELDDLEIGKRDSQIESSYEGSLSSLSTVSADETVNSSSHIAHDSTPNSVNESTGCLTADSDEPAADSSTFSSRSSSSSLTSTPELR